MVDPGGKVAVVEYVHSVSGPCGDVVHQVVETDTTMMNSVYPEPVMAWGTALAEVRRRDREHMHVTYFQNVFQDRLPSK